MKTATIAIAPALIALTLLAVPAASQALQGGGSGASAAPAAQGVPATGGERLFRQRCASCHLGRPGRVPTRGPELAGVVGRRAAATEFAYSPALRGSNLVWSRDTLDRFLTAPRALVPGTRMSVRISDPAQRAAIIDYLSSR